jgi:hypothetical protein
MKKIFKSLSVVLLAATLFSCTEGDNPIDTVLDDVTSGAALRNVTISNPGFTTGDAAAQFQATLEVQDPKNGQDTEKIDVYVTFLDKTAGNGSNSKPEVLLKTILSSAFVAGKRELPYANFTVTIAELKTKFGLTDAQYDGGDQFVVRLAQVLKDGRVFTRANSNSNVVGGAYFNSPFQYTVDVKCPFPDASLFNGNYKVAVDEWADYGIGDIVPVLYNVANGQFKFRILNTNNPYLNNTSSYYEVTVDPLTLVCTVKGNETFDYGSLKTNATGTGKVNVCNGNIDLVISYSGSLQSQPFSLVKN